MSSGPRPAASAPDAFRDVLLLSTGGTIAMATPGTAGGLPGDGAALKLGAGDLLGSVPVESFPFEVTAEAVITKPSAHHTAADQLEIARRARDAARDGLGVVVTHGTDTLEEITMLADLMHDAEAPIIFTGAIRPASLPGADGPANVTDAVTVAAWSGAADQGAMVCFGGEIHFAREVRKTDTTSPTAFSSPQTGPAGQIREGRPELWRRAERAFALNPTRLDFHVPVVPAFSGDDGRLARSVLAAEPDGVVVETLGAGHLSPAAFEIWAEAADRIPILATSRPERGTILRSTYTYEASEIALRRSGIIPAGYLSPQAARIKLLACLGTGLDREATVAAFSVDDR
ncbi:MAG: asparaginase [Solirubrobacterales bacterium]|nr:asparaginase [Solirubrobacterales bacterium]